MRFVDLQMSHSRCVTSKVGSGKVRQNTTVWLPSLLRRRWLHVSAALLGHHQVTRCTSEETIRCTNISYGTCFYKFSTRSSWKFI